MVSEESSPFLCRRPFLLFLLVLGAALRIYQYAADTSFWFDELSIARNVVHRSAGELWSRPLGYAQVAPVGFMVAEKLVTEVFGPSDLALRLLPFLCGLAALPLFLRLSRWLLVGYAVPFAVALFAIGAPFIRYSAEVKQYGLDVAAMLALSLMALRLREPDSDAGRCVRAGLFGAAVVWFSQASVFVMAGLGAALVVAWWRDRDAPTRRAIVTTVPIWAAASAAAMLVALARVTPQTRAFMHAFWSYRDAFPRWPLRKAGDAFWFWNRVVELFETNGIFRYRWPALYAALALAGLVLLWRRFRFGGLVLVGPLAAAVAAAVLQQYPFKNRVALFLLPALVLGVAEAAERIRGWAGRAHPAVGATLMAALLFVPVEVLHRTPPPYWVENHKEVLAFVRDHRQPGDAVFVFPHAYEAMERYGPAYGLSPADWVVGGCARDDLRTFLRDVDRFRGKPRVWLVASSVPSFTQARKGVVLYLDTIGTRREHISVPSEKPLDPVSATLYDLSDPARLAAASAETSPVETQGDLRPYCFDWIRPDAPVPDRPTAKGAP